MPRSHNLGNQGDDIIDLNVGDRHQQMVLLAAFGGLALLLVSLGLYGLLAQAVSARSRELGLRMALGATPGRLMTAVIARGVILTAVGVTVGGAAASAVTRTMTSLLYGVGAGEPATFAGVSALLGLVALVACALRAARAARAASGETRPTILFRTPERSGPATTGAESCR